MTFNMLDDFELVQDNYTPNFSAASRTGNMKKFAKKEQRPATATTLQKPVSIKPAEKDQFDDLLNDLIDSKEKSNSKRPQTSVMPTEKRNSNFLDDLKFSNDSGFGQKESITFNYQKTLQKPLESSKFTLSNSKDTFKLSDDFGTSNYKSAFPIIEDEDNTNFKSRRESTFRKQSPKNIIIEDDTPNITIGSSRMMRPPLGRKPSVSQLGNDDKQQVLGLSINQDARLSQTAGPQKFGAVGRRNSSLAQTPKDNFGFNREKQDNTQNKFSFLSGEQEPRLSRQSSSQFPTRMLQQKSLSVAEQQPKTIQKPVQRIVERIVERVVEGPKIDVSGIKQQHQKQLTLIKESYQKQIKILTDNYERQLKQQKQAKNKIMSDLKEMMDKQRQKNDRILNQEVERVKKMNDWEKQKLQTTYQSQIDRLKGIVSSQEKSIPEPSLTYLEKRRMEDLEQKLKYQLESVENEKKKLAKIEADLQQRQSEFTKFRVTQQKKLKQQYLKSNEKTLKDMKKISEQKNQIAGEKQKIALEMAQLQMDILHRQQKLATQQQSLKAHQQSFQRMKHDSQSLNQQLYTNYKLKLQQAEQSKSNALLLENDLVNKLKIVQLKGKDVYKGQMENPIFRNTFQLGKTGLIPSRPHSVTQSRFVPQDNSKRVKNVQNYMKSQGIGMAITNKTSFVPNNTSFTLDKFIKNVDGYKKEKRQMIF